MPGAGEHRLEPRDDAVRLASGLTLHFRRWGPAQVAPSEGCASAPFLLAHGLGSNARTWDGVGRALAQAGHMAVAVDLRGHGLSGKPATGYDMYSVSTDVAELVAALELDRPIMVGQSWGASVVLQAAIRYPRSARGVVLVDGHTVNTSDEFGTWEECWRRLRPPPSAGIPREKIKAWFQLSHPDWSDDAIEGSLGSFDVRGDRKVTPWLSLANCGQIVRALWEERVEEDWPMVGVPVLIVPVDCSDTIQTTSKRRGAEAAVSGLRARRVPVQVTWFKGDHDIHLQHPAELAGLLLQTCQTGIFGRCLTW